LWEKYDRLPPAPGDVVLLVDEMAFIHRHQDIGCLKFSDITEKYMNKLMMSCPARCKIFNFVGDRYDVTLSLKQSERTKRQWTQYASRSYAVQDNIPIPVWKQFIANPKNKSALQQHLQESWYRHVDLFPTTFIMGGLAHE